MATVLYGAFFIVIANALVDILYARLDPRTASRCRHDASRCSTCATCA